MCFFSVASYMVQMESPSARRSAAGSPGTSESLAPPPSATMSLLARGKRSTNVPSFFSCSPVARPASSSQRPWHDCRRSRTIWERGWTYVALSPTPLDGPAGGGTRPLVWRTPSARFVPASRAVPIWPVAETQHVAVRRATRVEKRWPLAMRAVAGRRLRHIAMAPTLLNTDLQPAEIAPFLEHFESAFRCERETKVSFKSLSCFYFSSHCFVTLVTPYNIRTAKWTE